MFSRKNQGIRRNRSDKQAGNVMIYVLLAIALFGGLTVMLSRQNSQSDSQDTTDENVEIAALNLMDYAASAQSVVNQMLLSGSPVDRLSFVNPTSDGFDSGSHIHKIYHPLGGGLNYVPALAPGVGTAEDSNWYGIAQMNNVAWTPSTQPDVIMTAIRIKKSICERVNERVKGDTDIPRLTTTLDEIFIDGDEDLTTDTCADCEGFVSICVQNLAQDEYAFYNIIASQ